MRQLKRSDTQYTDIETFEDYEKFQCLAYEMAIRQDEVIEILKKQVSDTNYKLSELSNKYCIDGGDGLHLKYHFFDDITEFKVGYDFGVLKPNMTKRKIASNRNLISNYLPNYGFTHRIYCEYSTIGFDEYIADSMIDSEFKRPTIFITEVLDLSTSVDINFSLPEKEILAYVKQIKKYFDKVKLEDTPHDRYLSNDPRNKEVDRILNNLNSMADLFYVYDCMKLGYKQRAIQREVYDYYADKGITTKTLDPKTLKRYNEIAIDFIENQRFIELVTGKSTRNFVSRNLIVSQHSIEYKNFLKGQNLADTWENYLEFLEQEKQD